MAPSFPRFTSPVLPGEALTVDMWNVADGSELIDPATGEVRPGVTRRYDPEDWEDYAFQASTRQEAIPSTQTLSVFLPG